MLLHWSPRSPFVHKVMVALEETGLRPRVDLTRSVVPTLDPEHVIYRVNPLGQIPTLELDDGRVLHDSLVIAFYLNDLCGEELLIPSNADKRIDTLRRHALGNGLIEAMVAWVIDRYTPPEKQIATRAQHYAIKLAKTLALLESDVGLRKPEPLRLWRHRDRHGPGLRRLPQAATKLDRPVPTNRQMVCPGFATAFNGCRTLAGRLNASASTFSPRKQRHGNHPFGHRLEHGRPHRRSWQEFC